MKFIPRFGTVALAGVALALASCSTGGRSPSGFLGNFKQLDVGYGTADAVTSFVNPEADLKKYDSVIIDPVTTVVAAPGIGMEVKEQLAAYLGDALRTEATGKLRIVSVPGPTTLRARTALTDVLEEGKGGNPVTTVHSDPKVTLTGRLGSETVAAFISNVAFEGEIVDSVTGERITALCDHRIGKKREATPATTWAAVRSGASQGAARLWQRFAAVRDR